MKISAQFGSRRPATAYPVSHVRVPYSNGLRRPCGCCIDPIVFGHWDPVTGERCGQKVRARPAPAWGEGK